VAAKGHQHFVVKKEFNQNKSFTRILKLEETGRIQEIARLLSGETITASAIENAKTLLGIQIN
jgi:DNA repair protein RecN (Recombination protein N)